MWEDPIVNVSTGTAPHHATPYPGKYIFSFTLNKFTRHYIRVSNIRLHTRYRVKTLPIVSAFFAVHLTPWWRWGPQRACQCYIFVEVSLICGKKPFLWNFGQIRRPRGVPPCIDVQDFAAILRIVNLNSGDVDVYQHVIHGGWQCGAAISSIFEILYLCKLGSRELIDTNILVRMYTKTIFMLLG